MQVDPIKPKLKPPGTKHLKLKKCDALLSSFAFRFNLRRYNEDGVLPPPPPPPPPPVEVPDSRARDTATAEALVDLVNEEEAAAEGVPPPVLHLHLQPPGRAARAQQGSHSPRKPL